MATMIHSSHLRTLARRALCLAVLVLAFCCIPQKSAAQEILDSRGKEFWLTFIPNFHSDDLDDSLHIFLTAEKATKGMIRYYDIAGEEHTWSFTITKPNEIVHFQEPASAFELVGINATGVFIPTNQNEQEAPQSFHITADDEITVYGLSQAMFSSDAFLALPADVLGTDYIVLAYNSDGITGLTQRTPSEFAVVATEDNTRVTITPSAATASKGSAPQTVILSRGGVYLVQADMNTDPNADLTGSVVESDKPVAVFAGHQRATIPVDVDVLSSRDHIVEQLLPVSTWGRSAFVVPYIPSPDEAPEGTDLFRVLAAYDGTQVSIDGVLTATLNRGEFLERPLLQAHQITATGQILVAQYRKTSGNDPNAPAFNVSDPFMMLIPPSEQFLPSYAFINAQGIQEGQDRQKTISYTLQYITIVIPDSSRSSVVIDGAPRTALPFTPIGTTGYSYAHVRMSDGSHTITADTGFGLYVYGYGPANSYGYIGGLRLEVLAKDGIPPRILSKEGCYDLAGMIFDTLSTDSRIRSVEAPASAQINTVVSIAPFTPYADSVSFNAALINRYDDGDFTIIAIDSARQRSEKQFVVSGFTVHVEPLRTDTAISRQATIATEKEVCSTFVLVNYGRTPQTLDTLLFQKGSKQFTTTVSSASLPIVLAPGATQTIEICFESTEEGTFDDTLLVVNRCTPRKLVAFSYQVRDDHDAPTLALNVDSCRTFATVSFTDSLLTDLGIEKVRVIETVNCDVKPDTSALPRFATLRVDVIDGERDAIFTVEASDYRGNTRYFRDTIQGYTLQFVPAGREVMIYGDEQRSFVQCDSVKLYNNGLLPFVVDEIFIAQNTHFSAPLSQFPLVIAPRDSANLLVCFNPREPQMYYDTLVIPRYCRSIALPLQGTGVPRNILTVGDPRCGISVVVSSSPPEEIAPVLYPNPADERATIKLGVRTHASVVLRIAGVAGNIVSTSSAEFNAGVYNIELDTSGLETGVYFCEIQVGSVRKVLPLHVIH